MVATQIGPVATAVATVATKWVRLAPAGAPGLGRTTCCMRAFDIRLGELSKTKLKDVVCDGIHKDALGVMLDMRRASSPSVLPSVRQRLANAFSSASMWVYCGAPSSHCTTCWIECWVYADLVQAMLSRWADRAR
jgi:hypothetical protein